jgi:hypothetical protein
MVKNYSNLSLDEINRLIEVNSMKLREIWDTDDGGSWAKYKAKCQPYWDDNEALYVARSMKEKPKMEPLSDFDRDCLMTIEEFRGCCECYAITGSDGIGYYATDKEVSNIDAMPEAFVSGNIRPDFTHVCWYNK